MNEIDTRDLYTEKISQWLDNELSSQEVTELQAHMTGCSSCRQAYDAMQRVDHLLRTAAVEMSMPAVGFGQRFEARLTQAQNRKPWQIWLAIGALGVGALSFVGVWTVVSGITLVTLSSSLLDVGLLHQWLVTFIQSVDMFRVFLNLGALILKASFITIRQPLFWVFVLVAGLSVGLWVQVVRMLSRRIVAPAELML